MRLETIRRLKNPGREDWAMEVVLAVIGGLVILFLIFKFLGGCLLKILLGLLVLAAIAYLVFSLIAD